MRERDFRNGMKELMGGSLYPKFRFYRKCWHARDGLSAYLLDGGLSEIAQRSGPRERADGVG